ncbi:DNA repair protein RecO [Psittacicella gerlachiana]|nr:recombination protein O N-terminal domain-containing protein [Psittacicella gerlachiana]
MTRDTWYTGFILYKEDYGNNSVRLYFLSIEKGLIHLYCKGANSKNSKLGPSLQYFSLLRLQVAGKLLNYISKVEIESLAIKYPTEQFYCACYINELITKILPTNSYLESEAFDLFNFYKNTLIELFYAENTQHQSLALRKFEINLLTFLGIIPYTAYDYQGQDIDPQGEYFLIQDQGFINHKQINLLTLDYLEQEQKLKQQWEQDPDSVDPLALQYLEYQHQQYQQQQKLTFYGKYLLLIHELFFENENRSTPTQLNLNDETKALLKEQDDQLASLLQVKIDLDEKRQVVTKITYQQLKNNFNEADLEQALAQKITQFKKFKEQNSKSKNSLSMFAQNFVNYNLFKNLDSQEQKQLLNQAHTLSKLYLNVLLGSRIIHSKEKLIEYKRLMASLT